MGKKSAYTGQSATDRSINLMDKFIKRNENKQQHIKPLPARRKDVNVPINLWPLQDQLDYYANRTDADRFDDDYSSYSTWYSTVKKMSGVYPRTFDEFTHRLKDYLRELWENKTAPKQAVYELRNKGVY